MFPPVGFAMLPKIIALGNAHFQSHINFADSEAHSVGYIAPARHPLEISLVADPFGMVLEE
jgi:hypothetical protein